MSPMKLLPAQSAINPLEHLQATRKFIDQRRNPEEEYFMLAVSALKMNFTELGGSNNDFIYEMHGPKLFKQAKALKVPFHKWYDWLNEKFMNLKQMQDDLMQQKEKELQQWQEI